jgi:hypothetical protein
MKNLSNMNFKECSAVLVNKTLYISGGTNNDVKNNFLYKIEPLSNINDQCSLIFVKDLNKHRIKHTSFYKNEFIYFVGGENDFTVQRYHINKDILESLPDLNKPRERCGCLMIDSILYIFFGKKNLHDQTKSFDTFECVNLNQFNLLRPNSMTEKSLTNLKKNFYNFGFVHHESNIYLCGGEENREIYSFDYSNINLSQFQKKLKKPTSFIHNDFTIINKKYVNFTYENSEYKVYSLDPTFFKINN